MEATIFPDRKMSKGIQTPAELGEQVRQRRVNLGLTQENLAAVSTVTPRLLGEVERGKRTTQLDGLLRILTALGLELELRER